MLTSDLLLVRTHRGEIRPRYVEVSNPELQEQARRLIEAFSAHRGRSRGELEAELADLLGSDTALVFHRGLVKLLFDRAELSVAAPADPSVLRRAVFEAAARSWRGSGGFTRETALHEAARDLALEPDALERSLYADLKDEQVLADWKPCTPAWLLNRYNVALAQAVLLRATELTVDLEGGSVVEQRALFRRIKFFQLLFRAERRPRGWRLRLDGPLSLFQASQRYGVQMASFLPTLLHLSDWSLEATLSWGKRREPRRFRLGPDAGLEPYGNLTGQWLPEELRRFPQDFAKLDCDWEISEQSEPLELGGQGVIVPDFTFEHRPSGRRAYLDVLGFWNQGSLTHRLDLLRQRGASYGNALILGVSKALATGRDDLADLPANVYVYRTIPLAKQVLERLEGLSGTQGER